MALKGQAKTDYQREYMRRRRAISNLPKPYRVITKYGVRPVLDPVKTHTLDYHEDAHSEPVDFGA